LRRGTLYDKVQGSLTGRDSVTAVERYFFTPLYYPRSTWSVVGWWESRRPFFNLCVGGAGLLSIGIASVLGRLPPHAIGFSVPWGAVLAYGVLANLCYTVGPLTDLLLRRVLGDRAPAVGPVLFRYGFVFSLGLTLLPIPVAVLDWLVRLFW
jgi:hypothetical protein